MYKLVYLVESFGQSFVQVHVTQMLHIYTNH